MKKKNTFIKSVFRVSAFIFLLFTSEIIFGQSQVTVSLNSQNTGVELPSDFVGLSYEMQRLLPDENGIYYFRATNKPFSIYLKHWELRVCELAEIPLTVQP